MGAVAALNDDYEGNLYISVRGLAYAVKGTEKAFAVTVADKELTVRLGESVSGKPSEWDNKALNSSVRYVLKRNPITVDGAEKKYFSFAFDNADGNGDMFFTPMNLGMLLDMDIQVQAGELRIDTTKGFTVTGEALEASGFSQDVNSLLVGDGTTGEIYYATDEEEAVPIASTTKLMTYFVAMDAVKAGECNLDDVVTISTAVAKLSHGSDGVISMSSGSKIPMWELLQGMLLPSSNECALAIAEHVAGSEQEFVKRMNEKAMELGLVKAQFYNCHGLPTFKSQLLAGKLQNHMTAGEMFVLASALLAEYPQVAEITSAKELKLPSLGVEIQNSNALVYNMDSVKGLKTGTTNKAGACLVTYIPTEKDGQTHNLICVLYGAEGEAERMTISEVAARYAVSELAVHVAPVEEPEDNTLPKNPEIVMQKLMRISHTVWEY